MTERKKMINFIVKILTRKRRLAEAAEKLYDHLYAEAEAILKEHNPCRVHTCSAGVVCTEWVCLRKEREAIRSYTDARANTLCCTRCQFHDKAKGCQAEKPLPCKLWLCEYAKKLFPEAEKKLKALRYRADIFFVFRGDKKMCLGEALNVWNKLALIEVLKYEKIDI